jgi:hypothetical protein
LLKRRPFGREWHVEPLALAREVFADLPGGGLENAERGCLEPVGTDPREVLLAFEVQTRQARAVRRQ